jgi:DNA-nicking Smr family endonuclease
LNDNISDKDKKDWQTFISSKEKIVDKDFKHLEKNHFKVKSIDLHGYTLEKANNAVEQFIFKAFEEGVSKLIVVTGKGIHSDVEKNPYVSKDLSILRYSVPEYIKTNVELMNLINEFKEADIQEGGEGAFYIFLKKKKL